ncbi:molybdenum cofactor cytidylyltransferase [Aquabacterium commune]|uniref:Molybdenum cofactor cytidylyltransferase n=1 Tax=Aquabacterium commune TaxID=70586 RepID=A0A4R6RIB0_9BURK|nr:nucleotidyltransferase family protein [Aquabacterium commune]TDP86064.1 molybdenum cofactor cytidylyltransferase [Aquabacterium commune]
MPSPRVVVLVLAAGASTRFGSDKRQALLPDGRSLLDAVVATHREVFDEVWVLSRPTADGQTDAFAQSVCDAHGARCMPCPDAVLGQGHTLAAGLRLLQAEAGLSALAGAPGEPVAAALVALADMPWVRADTLQRLRERFEATGRVVLPRCGEALGHPRLLPRAVWLALLGDAVPGAGSAPAHAPGPVGLRGDRGAQALLDWAEAEQVVVDDLGVLRDADTPADLRQGNAALPPTGP